MNAGLHRARACARCAASWVLLVAVDRGRRRHRRSAATGTCEQREARAAPTPGSALQEARARLESARRERDSLQESADVFRTLVERGLLQGERRLDLVELVNALRARHQLFALDYEIAPQRPLQLAGGRVFTAVDVLASRVKLRARALHEGDVLGFVDGARRAAARASIPLDRCVHAARRGARARRAAAARRGRVRARVDHAEGKECRPPGLSALLAALALRSPRPAAAARPSSARSSTRPRSARASTGCAAASPTASVRPRAGAGAAARSPAS